MRRRVYIVKEGKCKILSKNNNMNRFNKWVNRFKPLHDKLGKARMLWSLMRIRMDLNQLKLPKMKIDTIQNIMNRFRASQWYFVIRLTEIWDDSKWIDSNILESIQAKSEIFLSRFKHIWIDSCRRNKICNDM